MPRSKESKAYDLATQKKKRAARRAAGLCVRCEQPCKGPLCEKHRTAQDHAVGEWQRTHKERMLEYDQAYRVRLSNPINRIKDLLKHAKSRAKATGRIFAITADDLKMPVNCPCCGTTIDLEIGSGHKQRGPSLDRRNNALGYLPNNVAIICLYCNTLKRDATAEQLKAIIKYIENAPDQRARCSL